MIQRRPGWKDALPPDQNRYRLVVALVAPIWPYATQLSDSIRSSGRAQCNFYGPKGYNPLGPVTRSLNYNPVWTAYRYPFQIIKRVCRDRPHVIHFDFALITFGKSYLSSLLLAFLIPILRIIGFKVVLTIHDVVTKQALRDFGIPRLTSGALWMGVLAFYKLLSLSNTLIVHRKLQRDILVNRYKIHVKKINVVPFGVGKPEQVSEDLLKHWRILLDGKQIVLCFGSIVPRRGHEFLIDGFAQVAGSLPDAILVVAGSVIPKQRNYLMNLVHQATSSTHSARIRFFSYLQEKEANALVYSSKVMVLPYTVGHGTASVLYWAVQYHKPVIATQVDSLVEELEGYPQTLLIPPKNASEIARALREVFQDRNLEDRARDFMKMKCAANSWDNVSKLIFTVYDNLLAKH